MTSKRLGRQTVRLAQPPSVVSYANIGGKFEGNGPLAEHFDQLCPDSFFGKDTWEQAESAMQQRVLERALEKGGLMPKDLDYVLAGDLLNQCIGTAFGLRGFDIPFFGLYGACSTMGESLALGSLLISGGHARMTACMTSSHFCTAERQYRMPVPYGSQRTPTAQWTATASGCCILADQGDGPYITHVTCGRIVDKGITDVNNMGAAMAPAACDTLSALFRETKTGPGDYDLIITGDLGVLGHAIVTDLLGREGVDLSRNYQDCGMLLYDLDKQDMHAGASGCGCSAAVLNGYLLGGMQQGRWQRVVFAPTGALLSPTSSFQGESIPGICHAVVFSAQKEGLAMEYLNAFLCGGVLCAVGQVLIDRTRLTPARILTGYVVAGVLLQAVGVYQPLVNWGGAGATVPLTGFGYCLAKGVRKAVAEQGLLGALTGGLTAAAGGIAAAVVFGVLAALLFRPGDKR